MELILIIGAGALVADFVSGLAGFGTPGGRHPRCRG
jgi:hypothetical protein